MHARTHARKHTRTSRFAYPRHALYEDVMRLCVLVFLGALLRAMRCVRVCVFHTAW